jgi:succinate dehydrogenase / fumarate reductase membrane anchor subunit
VSLQTPLGRVLGLGSARDGVHHWWVQRLTSVALIPLSVWLLVSLLALPSLDYATVHAWIAHGWTAFLLSLVIGVAAWHSQLGMQVIIEDYVHGGTKTVTLVVSTFAHVLLGAAAIFATLRIAFGGAA